MWCKFNLWCFAYLLGFLALACAIPQPDDVKIKRSLWDGFFTSNRHHHHPEHVGHSSGTFAGSSAQAGSSAGSIGGHSQSQANAQSYSSSFNAGPFSASFSNSQAQSNSHAGGGYGDWLFGVV